MDDSREDSGLWEAFSGALREGAEKASSSEGEPATDDLGEVISNRLLLGGARAANPGDDPPALSAAQKSATAPSRDLRKALRRAFFPQVPDEDGAEVGSNDRGITFGEAVWRTIALGLLGGLSPTDPDEKPFVHRLQQRLVALGKRINVLGEDVELSTKEEYNELAQGLLDQIIEATPDPRHGGIASEHDIAAVVDRLTVQRVAELYTNLPIYGVEPSAEERALGEQLYKLLPFRSQAELKRRLLIKVTEAQRDVQAGNLRDELAISYKKLFDNLEVLRDQDVEKIFVRSPLQAYGAMTREERQTTENVRWSLTYDGLFIAGVGDEDDVEISYESFLEVEEQMIVNWSATGDVIRDTFGFFRDRIEPTTERILGGTLQIVRVGDGHVHAEIPVERPDELMVTIMAIAKAKQNLEYLEELMREHAVNQSPSKLREIDPKMVMLAMPDPTAFEFPPPQFRLNEDNQSLIRDLDREERMVDELQDRQEESLLQEPAIQRLLEWRQRRAEGHEPTEQDRRIEEHLNKRALRHRELYMTPVQKARQIMIRRRQNPKLRPPELMTSTSQ